MCPVLQLLDMSWYPGEPPSSQRREEGRALDLPLLRGAGKGGGQELFKGAWEERRDCNQDVKSINKLINGKKIKE